MSDRNDRKLEQVPVGTYTYRHEAEFAAGFLESAGIPYRLQIEDPALGLSASESARLWVHAVDEQRAREVLDQENGLQEDQTGERSGEGGWAEDDGRAGEGDLARRDDLARRGERLEETTGRADGDRVGRVERDRAAPSDRRPGKGAVPDGGRGTDARGPLAQESGPGTDLQGNSKPDLTLRERVLALVGGLGVSSLMGLDVVLDAHPAIPWTVGILAVALVLAGVLGRAPGPLKSLLSTLSGDAP